MQLKKLLAEIRPLRFLIAGGLAACTEYGVFLLLHGLGLHLLVANSVSFCTGLLVSFTLNKKWVFSSGGKTHLEFIAYAGLAIVNLVLSNILIYIVVNRFGWLPWVAKILTMALIACWNYVIFSRVIFRTKKDQNSSHV
ncbi:GtrA family protein [Candidatus Saccharibacteria bacterium]|nr:MAG: GtrA family protein [Candidatus Saccharibacteria bacterium]